MSALAPSRQLALVWLASAAVLALATITSFRLGIAADLATLARINGPRVVLGAAAGAAFSLFAGLRLWAGDVRPLADLQLFAIATAAAGGGFLAASGRTGTAGVAIFSVAAIGFGALAWALVRLLDRPKRWTNFGAALALTVSLALAAYTGGYVRARLDVVAPIALWLLGDLSRAEAAPALAVLAVVAALVASAAVRRQHSEWAVLALGVGIGAAGPLPFVGTFSARAVNRIAPHASHRARILASAGASAAAVVAIDAVPRLLVGGYALPFAVASGILATPIFLIWNRARLIRLAGPRRLAFEIAEGAVIALMTAFSLYHAYLLTKVVRGLT